MLEETEPQTLQQQENMSIKGQSARHLVMQKLMRKVEVLFNVILFNYHECLVIDHEVIWIISLRSEVVYRWFTHKMWIQIDISMRTLLKCKP